MKLCVVLILLVMLGAVSCQRHGRDIVISIPDKFTGLLLICEDKEKGLEPEIINNQYVLVVPPNGKLVIKNSDIFDVWHKEICQYKNGAYLPVETPANDTEIALFNLPYVADYGHYSFVGTHKDFDPISKGYDYYRLPLAKKIEPSMLKKAGYE